MPRNASGDVGGVREGSTLIAGRTGGRCLHPGVDCVSSQGVQDNTCQPSGKYESKAMSGLGWQMRRHVT